MRDSHCGFRISDCRIDRLDFPNEEIHQPPVQIIAAEARVAVGGQHLENAFVQFQNREVERAAAQIINRDFGFLLQLVQAVGQRGSGRFVEDAFDRESGQFAGALGGVALRVVEIRRHGDDGARDRFAEIIFRVTLQFFQNLGGNFLRRIISAVNWNRHRAGAVAFDGIRHQHFLLRNIRAAPADEAFNRINRFRRLDGAHTIRLVADHGPGVRRRKMHNRRRQPPAFSVGDDERDARIHRGDQRIRGAQVDADDFAHHPMLPRNGGKTKFLCICPPVAAILVA